MSRSLQRSAYRWWAAIKCWLVCCRCTDEWMDSYCDCDHAGWRTLLLLLQLMHGWDRTYGKYITGCSAAAVCSPGSSNSSFVRSYALFTPARTEFHTVTLIAADCVHGPTADRQAGRTLSTITGSPRRHSIPCKADMCCLPVSTVIDERLNSNAIQRYNQIKPVGNG